MVFDTYRAAVKNRSNQNHDRATAAFQAYRISSTKRQLSFDLVQDRKRLDTGSRDSRLAKYDDTSSDDDDNFSEISCRTTAGECKDSTSKLANFSTSFHNGVPCLPLADRKRRVLYNTPLHIIGSLERWTEKLINDVLGNQRQKPDSCWVHVGWSRSKKLQQSQRPGIRKTEYISTAAQIEYHNSYAMQSGLARLLVKNLLTEEQKQGIINHAWHLIHLCGEMRCLNVGHFTVEPGATNQSRKICMRERKCHSHTPPCWMPPQPSRILGPKHMIPLVSSKLSDLEDSSEEESEKFDSEESGSKDSKPEQSDSEDSNTEDSDSETSNSGHSDEERRKSIQDSLARQSLGVAGRSLASAKAGLTQGSGHQPTWATRRRSDGRWRARSPIDDQARQMKRQAHRAQFRAFRALQKAHWQKRRGNEVVNKGFSF
ncbi:hypothetical protein EJ08DRAFT_695075 [Tothia fuscella]|uniref:Zinc-binding loop region of homing endonuclease domain-containing protein n=1 Tax=Tothia fuscella TaxID=1048955 RepID=A0A9P4NWK6_9PEZI|nr:hypothetical protein EJ08DRAFT_695075 [Tothia fuscella]